MYISLAQFTHVSDSKRQKISQAYDRINSVKKRKHLNEPF